VYGAPLPGALFLPTDDAGCPEQVVRRLLPVAALLDNPIPIGILMHMDNREAILERAMELFALRGYDAVGVQEIASSAGVTKPTLYHYFGSKQGLLKQLVAVHSERLHGRILQAAEYHGDLPLTLRKLAKAFFSFASENPVYYRWQLSAYFAPEECEAHREVAELNQKQYAVLEELFIKAAVNHGNMKGRHKLYAASFLGMINNCVGLALNGFIVLDEVFMDRAVHYFEHGIYS
jgi:AcrR family transcriptional regulator